MLLVMGGRTSEVWWPPELIDGLVSAGYRVVQHDDRNVGLSTHLDRASASYGVEDMATDALGVLDALGIAAAHVVGVSLGGMIAQVAALRKPDRVQGRSGRAPDRGNRRAREGQHGQRRGAEA